jgi:predicted dithiol-disulfide oxidoreductase (DUF899 family)
VENRFPGESPDYREARERLLAQEVELRRSIEAVAAARRELPPGGAVPEDYLFEERAEDEGTKRVRLSELFTPGKETLIVYSFMYGPEMDEACPACTSIVDGLDASAHNVTQRVDLAVVAKSPLPRILAFAQERGWRRVRLLSAAGNTYNRDYFGETADGEQTPMLNVFVRDGDEIRHFWGSELFFAPRDDDQEMRHVDSIWPLWNLFDLTPQGRGTDTDFPKLSYDA